VSAAPVEPRREGRFVAVLLHETRALLDDRLYYGPMLQGLNNALLEKGQFVRLIQCLHEYQKENFLQSPERLYTGAVFLGPLYKFELFIKAAVQHVAGPKVILDHHFDHIPIHSVRDDAVTGMRALAGHLLALGHRAIAYVDNDHPQANPWKRDGVDQALRAAGLPVLGRGWVAGCRRNFGDAAAALDWFLGLTPRPTAVICADDARALLMLQAAAERGLRVPADLSVAGYGDSAVLGGQSRALTSVHIDAALMGRRAAELVTGDPQAPPTAALVAPELAARGTTAAPPQ
jgi:LacI family transcriptional regulator